MSKTKRMRDIDMAGDKFFRPVDEVKATIDALGYETEIRDCALHFKRQGRQGSFNISRDGLVDSLAAKRLKD